MEKTKVDYRKVSPNEVFAVKKEIINQYKQGLKTSEIQKNTGMCIDIVRKTIHDYKEGGLDALSPKKEGRPQGSGMRLTKEQSDEIKDTIIHKDPIMLNLPFALWTSMAVKDLVKAKCEIELPIRTVSEYMKRLNFSVQKPMKDSNCQHSDACVKWLDETYSDIRKQAQKEDALIYWMKTTTLQSGDKFVSDSSSDGITTSSLAKTKNAHIEKVSAVNNTGKVYFKFYNEAMSESVLRDFCERLVSEQQERKIILLCDESKSCQIDAFRDWLEAKKNLIDVYYYPSGFYE